MEPRRAQDDLNGLDSDLDASNARSKIAALFGCGEVGHPSRLVAALPRLYRHLVAWRFRAAGHVAASHIQTILSIEKQRKFLLTAGLAPVNSVAVTSCRLRDFQSLGLEI